MDSYDFPIPATTSTMSNTGKTSPPLPHHPKPRSAVPSHLLNGHSPLSQSTNLSSSTVTRPEERDKLASSIRASYDRRMPIADPLAVNGYNKPGYEDDVDEDSIVNIKSESLTTSTNPREGLHLSPPMSDSRPQSPYTMAPPIDFDGLSWPCMYNFTMRYLANFSRHWYTRTT